jgi:hypothetical protein
MDFTEIYKQTAGLVAFSPGTHFVLTAVEDRVVVRRADSFHITRTWQIGAFSSLESSTSQPGNPQQQTAQRSGASSAWITHAGWSCDSEYVMAACAQRGVVEVFKLRDEEWNARIECGAEGLAKAEWTPDGRAVLCFSEWGVSCYVYL